VLLIRCAGASEPLLHAIMYQYRILDAIRPQNVRLLWDATMTFNLRTMLIDERYPLSHRLFLVTFFHMERPHHSQKIRSSSPHPVWREAKLRRNQFVFLSFYHVSSYQKDALSKASHLKIFIRIPYYIYYFVVAFTEEQSSFNLRSCCSVRVVVAVVAIKDKKVMGEL
jgi:hypothetical protein